MGLVDQLRYSKIYFDANIFIYTFEGYSLYQPMLFPVMELSEHNDIFAVTSELTLAEVIVAPLLHKNKELEQFYSSTIQDSSSLNVIPLRRDILLSAVRIRVDKSVKLIDALHLATAQSVECDIF